MNNNEKFPYFRFYVSDFFGSYYVQKMNDRQVGWYHLWMAHSWDAERPCFLPNDPDLLFELSRCKNRSYFDANCALVLDRFKVTDDGQFIFNSRLLAEYEEVYGKHSKLAAAGRKGGLSSAEARLEPGFPPEPEPEPEPKSEPEKSISSELDSAVEELFFYYCQTIGKNPKLYELDDTRRKQGKRRLQESIRKARRLENKEPLRASVEYLKSLIDKLARSDFHNARGKHAGGTKYLGWEQIFGSAKRVDNWEER